MGESFKRTLHFPENRNPILSSSSEESNRTLYNNPFPSPGKNLNVVPIEGQDGSVSPTTSQASLHKSSGLEALEPFADELIRRQPTVKLSPAPIGDRKISPSQFPNASPSSTHISTLFGISHPFGNVLQPSRSFDKQLDDDLGISDLDLDDALQMRRNSDDGEAIFGMDLLDPGSSSESASPRTLSPATSFDQSGHELGSSSSFGEHPQGEHPSRTLFVRNINSNVDDAELTALFEQYGPIRSIYTQCKHRGFVMISYFDIRHAKNAMRHLQGKVIRRRKLDIHYSIPKDNPSEKDQNQGTLVVFNLDPVTTNEELKIIFGSHGEIKEIRETPNKKHHKFVEFFDVRDAEKALKALNKTEIRGKKIKIEPSRPGGRKNSNPPAAAADPSEEDYPPFYQSGSLNNFGSSTVFTPSNHSYPPLQQTLPRYKPGPVGPVGIVGTTPPTSPPPAGPNPFMQSGMGGYPTSPQPSHLRYSSSNESAPFAASPHSVWTPLGSTDGSPSPFAPSPSRSPFDSQLKYTGSNYHEAPSAIPKHFSRERSSSDGSDDGHPHTRAKRSDSGEDVSRFRLDLSKVGKEDSRTTLMIKNIPNKYNQKMLLSAVDEKHRGTYDFFYLPIDFKNKCNVGYAFINFMNYESIKSFYSEFNGKKWEKFNSEKVCNIAFARIQGKSALIQHFQNSSLMCEDKKCRPLIFKSEGPNMGEQEPFPVGPNARSRPAN